MNTDELEDLGYTDIKVFENGRQAAIAPLMFTHAIICDIDKDGYNERWCYHSKRAAFQALDAWDGKNEPEGWHRHPKSGRRRDEDGNETIRF